MSEVHCVCPKCNGLAVIKAESKYSMPWRPYHVSLVCLDCIHREDWPSKNWESEFSNYNPGSGIEPYFGYQLKLHVDIKGQSFGIYNPVQAVDIKEYIEATDRPSPENSKWSMVNRLPKWLKLAKNRNAVLRSINKLLKEL